MVKIIFDDCKPCPIDSSIMCEHSKSIVKEMNISLNCNFCDCHKFNFYRYEDEIYAIKKLYDEIKN